MRVAITGAGGRLGRALLAALGGDAIPWLHADFDLDAPRGADVLLDRDRPGAVIHAAAWTDVDGCARDPELAQRRNGHATGVLADACAARGIHLISVSTNEVFDGLRTDGRGYGPDDTPAAVNPYGASKLAGERAAQAAFARGRSGAHLAIVRTAWLFGPPGRDFPDKILAAAERGAATGETLRLVADEIGNPTSTVHLAAACAALVNAGIPQGTHHVVNAGSTSRAGWAREILRLADFEDLATVEVPGSAWPRASAPPPRAVLAATALPGGLRLPSWQAATAAYLPWLIAARTAVAS